MIKGIKRKEKRKLIERKKIKTTEPKKAYKNFTCQKKSKKEKLKIGLKKRAREKKRNKDRFIC